MSNLPTQHRPRSFLPELSELFEGFPSWSNLRGAFGNNFIRVEDEQAYLRCRFRTGPES